MKILVTSNQHPNERYALEIWGVLREELGKDTDITFYKFPDKEYYRALQSFSEAIQSVEGIERRLDKIKDPAKRPILKNFFDHMNSKYPAYKDAGLIANYIATNYDADGTLLEDAITLFPEKDVIENRICVDYNTRNRELCEKVSSDVVVDLHNMTSSFADERLRPTFPVLLSVLSPIEVCGFPRGSRFNEINKKIYGKYPTRAPIEALLQESGFVVEIPGVCAKTQLSDNVPAYILFGEEAYNGYLSIDMDPAITENKELLTIRVAQVKDVISALLEHEL